MVKSPQREALEKDRGVRVTEERDWWLKGCFVREGICFEVSFELPNGIPMDKLGQVCVHQDVRVTYFAFFRGKETLAEFSFSCWPVRPRTPEAEQLVNRLATLLFQVRPMAVWDWCPVNYAFLDEMAGRMPLRAGPKLGPVA